jgi:hypothetical protein
MDRYEGHLSVLTISLHRHHYLANIMVPNEGHLTALTIALHTGLYLAIIMDRNKDPTSFLL